MFTEDATIDAAVSTKSTGTPASSRDLLNVALTVVTAAIVAFAIGRLSRTQALDSVREEARRAALGEMAPARLDVDERLESLSRQADRFRVQLQTTNQNLKEKEQQVAAAVASLQTVMESVSSTSESLHQEIESHRQQVRADLAVSMKTLEESVRALATNERVGSDIIGTLQEIMPTLKTLPSNAVVTGIQQEVVTLQSSLAKLQDRLDVLAPLPVVKPEVTTSPSSHQEYPPTIHRQEDDYIQKLRARVNPNEQ